jgi:hypothetical protein
MPLAQPPVIDEQYEDAAAQSQSYPECCEDP